MNTLRNKLLNETKNSDLFDVALLRPAITQSLYSAFDIRARANFLLLNQQTDMAKDGKIMIGMNPEQWEGYHWVALSHSGESGARDLMEQCYSKSVSKAPSKLNPDNINLAELYFLRNDPIKSYRYSGDYLRAVDAQTDGPSGGASIIANFYNALAGYLIDDVRPGSGKRKITPADFRKLFLEQIIRKNRTADDLGFDARELNLYIKDPSNLPEDKRDEILITISCLLGKTATDCPD